MILVSLLRRVLISWSGQWSGRTRDDASNTLPCRYARRIYACPPGHLLALSLLISLTAQGCKKQLTMGDFVTAYCTVYSPDHQQVALGVLESERQDRAREETDSSDPDRLSPRHDYDRLFPPPVYRQHFPIYLRDAKTGKHQRSLRGHKEAVVCLAYSPDGSLLASGSNDSTISLWDPHTGKRVHHLKGHGIKDRAISVTSVTFSPDGKTLTSRDDTGIMKLWDVVTGKELPPQGDLRADLSS